MFSKTARYYDRIYSRLKDYREEARKVHTILAKEHPSAATILDAGCGTGEHARILHEAYGYRVDGIDRESRFVEIAQRKIPSGSFHCLDMRRFRLEKTYDVIMCLFSAIGYVKTLEGLKETLYQFRIHLEPDGVILVEPWFTPEEYPSGRVRVHTADDQDMKIVRMSHSQVSGRISRIQFQYLIGTHEGIEHEFEDHELGLFTVEEMKSCFEAGGLTVTHDEIGIFDRGLYTARIA